MTWSRLQSCAKTVSSGNGSAGGSGAAPNGWASNLSAGSKLIAAVVVSNSSGGVEPVAAVSDGTNAFTKRSSVVLTGSVFAEFWDLDTPAGDVGIKPVITATVSSNFGVSLLVQEIAGLAAGTSNAAVLDGTPGQNHGTASPATTGATSSSAANEYTAVLYGDPGDGISVSTPAGYTADANVVNASGLATLFLAYKNSSNGSESASFTLSGSAVDGWETILLTYQLAGAGGGSPVLAPRSGRRTAARTPSLPPVRRYRQVLPVPAQINPPCPFAELSQHREAWPRALPRRAHVSVAVPKQLNPPFPVAELTQRRETWAKAWPRRGRQVSPVPAQVNPPYLFAENRQQRQPRGFFPRRGRSVTPVPGQQSAPLAVFVPQQPHRARLAVPTRRARLTAPVAGQHEPPRQGHARRLALPVLRRPRQQPVPQQAAAPGAPAQVQSHRSPARAVTLIRRAARRLMPWAVSAPPPFSVGTLTAAAQASSALTDGEASSALTAGTAATGSLTAGTSRTGGPG